MPRGPAGSLVALVALAAVAALAGCHDEHWLTYPWDDRLVLCSQTIDDLSQDAPWDLVDDQMAVAERTKSVLLLHAHIPEVTISIDAIERVLTMAEAHHLEFVTFRELVPVEAGGESRAGLALAFDDNAIDAWFAIRDRLAGHGALVTFFVARWSSRSETERVELRALADAGHDVEPHSVNHLHAAAYAHDHGVAGYMSDEVQPSIDGLVDAGYPPPAVYAYPFGEHTAALDAAVLAVVPRIRLSPGSCPY